MGRKEGGSDCYFTSLSYATQHNLYKIDKEKKLPKYRKDRKFYFRDPLIKEVVRKWISYNNEMKESTIAEHTVLEHLFRIEGKENLLFYNDGKREVDAILLMKNNELIPIEVKWQNSISNSDFEGLYSFGKGIMLTKNKFEIHKGRYLLIPVALFLLLLDVGPFRKIKLVE